MKAEAVETVVLGALPGVEKTAVTVVTAEDARPVLQGERDLAERTAETDVAAEEVVTEEVEEMIHPQEEDALLTGEETVRLSAERGAKTIAIVPAGVAVLTGSESEVGMRVVAETAAATADEMSLDPNVAVVAAIPPTPAVAAAVLGAVEAAHLLADATTIAVTDVTTVMAVPAVRPQEMREGDDIATSAGATVSTTAVEVMEAVTRAREDADVIVALPVLGKRRRNPRRERSSGWRMRRRRLTVPMESHFRRRLL